MLLEAVAETVSTASTMANYRAPPKSRPYVFKTVTSVQYVGS